jgi:uncharacterized protein YlbG (UPF0298 family)
MSVEMWLKEEVGSVHRYVFSAVAIAVTSIGGTRVKELDSTVPIITVDYPDVIQLPDRQVIRVMWFDVLPMLLKKYGRVIFNNPERNYVALVTKEDIIKELKRRLRNERRRKYKDEFAIEAYSRALEYLTA